MNRLLSANFIRLKKNKLFWAGIVFMFMFAVFMISTRYRQHTLFDFEVSLNSVLFGYTLPLGMIIAVFSSIFLGTEYSDGTIRNKIVIGHSRMNIYFANLITNITVSFLFCLSFLLAVVVVGIPLLGFAVVDTIVILELFAGTLLLSIAFCSIFTMIAMICGDKTKVAVISILFVVVLFLVTTYVNSKLDASEFLPGYSIDNVTGNMISEPVPNPNYLRGTQRAVYEFIYDFLPTGQSVQYMTMEVKYIWRLPLFSLLITIVTTIAGAVIFKRKDIK